VRRSRCLAGHPSAPRAPAAWWTCTGTTTGPTRATRNVTWKSLWTSRRTDACARRTGTTTFGGANRRGI